MARRRRAITGQIWEAFAWGLRRGQQTWTFNLVDNTLLGAAVVASSVWPQVFDWSRVWGELAKEEKVVSKKKTWAGGGGDGVYGCF